ncbi:MAG TPA: alpha/beta hydrolase [Rhodoblastus sp.]|nr:alpha/beta hydrolase [Rhodoblastus sp.]
MTLVPDASQPQNRFVSAPDGLKLHYVEYGSALDPGAPVVCLPGLTRTAEDFASLARALSSGGRTRRRVLALDYRGRGLSDRDRKWENYSIPVENADILSLLDAAEVHAAIVVGTSRGGLHAMTFAATRPTLLKAVVLNDIGAVVEPLGLMRIKSYVGKMPAPRNWAEAVDIVKSTMSAHFTGLSEQDWEGYARRTFAEKDGKFVGRSDPQIANTLADVGPDMQRIELWPQFEAMAQVPTLVVRGENSDLLSAETLEKMKRRSPRCESWITPGQGHAPLLTDVATIERIRTFVDAVA